VGSCVTQGAGRVEFMAWRAALRKGPVVIVFNRDRECLQPPIALNRRGLLRSIYYKPGICVHKKQELEQVRVCF
jgi:hypothetical protein